LTTSWPPPAIVPEIPSIKVIPPEASTVAAESICSAPDLALNVANNAAEHGSDPAQRLVGALELFGMGIALVADRPDLAAAFALPLSLAHRVRDQRQRQRGKKVCSLHAPECHQGAAGTGGSWRITKANGSRTPDCSWSTI
jgi:hypothetical protein